MRACSPNPYCLRAPVNRIYTIPAGKLIHYDLILVSTGVEDCEYLEIVRDSYLRRLVLRATMDQPVDERDEEARGKCRDVLSSNRQKAIDGRDVSMRSSAATVLADFTLWCTPEQLAGDLLAIGPCRWNSVHKSLDVIGKIIVSVLGQ
jgi:hypothetical protein